MAKIVIIDDEKTVLKGYVRELHSAGYDAIGFSDPREAIEMLKNETIDIVLLDLMLAETTGTVVCAKIKDISPETEVILMSGFPEETERFQMDFINAGGKDLWLRKPLMDNELIEAVRNILAKRKEA